MTAQKRRRNNAPVRPRRPATGVPDLLFAIATALATMAAVFVAASFLDEDLSNGDAGTDLARIFAGTLMLSAILLALMGFLLLRDERGRADHYRVPILIGLLVGGLEAAMFLDPRSPILLLAPLALLIFVLRPVRRAIAAMLGGRG
jgi:hypothetical protein